MLIRPQQFSSGTFQIIIYVSQPTATGQYAERLLAAYGHWEILTALKEAEGLIQGPSARATQGTVKIKQKRVTVRGWTIYKALSPNAF